MRGVDFGVILNFLKILGFLGKIKKDKNLDFLTSEIHFVIVCGMMGMG